MNKRYIDFVPKAASPASPTKGTRSKIEKRPLNTPRSISVPAKSNMPIFRADSAKPVNLTAPASDKTSVKSPAFSSLSSVSSTQSSTSATKTSTPAKTSAPAASPVSPDPAASVSSAKAKKLSLNTTSIFESAFLKAENLTGDAKKSRKSLKALAKKEFPSDADSASTPTSLTRTSASSARTSAATTQTPSASGNSASIQKDDLSVAKLPRSPFVNTDKVKKRPLSKNVYERAPVVPAKEEPKGPVTIIMKPEKDSKAGLIVAIILTIILGAAAGTVAFLLLPK